MDWPWRNLSPEAPTPRFLPTSDYCSGKSNLVLTAGRTAAISGSNLMFDSDDPAQGVFFVNDATGEECRSDRVISVTNGKVVFNVPEAAAARMSRIEIRRGFGSVIHSGVMGNIEMVVAA